MTYTNILFSRLKKFDEKSWLILIAVLILILYIITFTVYYIFNDNARSNRLATKLEQVVQNQKWDEAYIIMENKSSKIHTWNDKLKSIGEEICLHQAQKFYDKKEYQNALNSISIGRIALTNKLYQEIKFEYAKQIFNEGEYEKASKLFYELCDNNFKIANEWYTKAVEAEKKEYESSITYDNLARYANDNIGEKVCFNGTIVQINGDNSLRLKIDLNNFLYIGINNKTEISISGELLEGDHIKVRGMANGTMTYESVIGTSITIPYIDARYIEVR